MLTTYLLFFIVLQLSTSAILSNKSSQRTTIVDQRVTKILLQNWTTNGNDDELRIHEQIESVEDMKSLRDDNESISIDVSNLTTRRIGFPKTIYYIRHFQALHNVDSRYLHVLDPDLTTYGFQQGSQIKFDDDQLELIICSPLTRTIQTYLSLFHDKEKRDRIPFKLDADLQEIGGNLADTPRSKSDLKQKFPELSSIIDRDLDENFNDKNNPLYSASSSKVKERVIRFHQRLLKRYTETRIMIVTHGGWLRLELNGKWFENGQIAKQIYENEDDVATGGSNRYNTKRTDICLLVFVYLILL